MTETNAERPFEELSWHDNHIYGIDFRVGDPELEDWTSDLVLDIDYIVEWVCEGDSCRFLIAPAALVFHGVTDLQIGIDWGSSEFRVAPNLPSIDHIERDAVVDANVYLDRPYYRWSIRLNAPRNGFITFGAVGFTQTLRDDPVLCDQQRLGRTRQDKRGRNAG